MLGEVERAGGESKRERRVWIKRQWMKGSAWSITGVQKHLGRQPGFSCKNETLRGGLSVDEMNDSVFMFLSVLS